MAQLSEWLQLMLAEIARQHEEDERARAEARAREREGRATDKRAAPEDLNTP